MDWLDRPVHRAFSFLGNPLNNPLIFLYLEIGQIGCPQLQRYDSSYADEMAGYPVGFHIHFCDPKIQFPYPFYPNLFGICKRLSVTLFAGGISVGFCPFQSLLRRIFHTAATRSPVIFFSRLRNPDHGTLLRLLCRRRILFLGSRF